MVGLHQLVFNPPNQTLPATFRSHTCQLRGFENTEHSYHPSRQDSNSFQIGPSNSLLETGWNTLPFDPETPLGTLLRPI